MDGLNEISSHLFYLYFISLYFIIFLFLHRSKFQEPESSLLKDEDWKK